MSADLFSVLVLAGGQSSRMGQDKALLSVHGVPLVRRVCEAALATGAAVTVVTPWPQRYRALLPPTLTYWVEQQPSPPQGPMAGLAQALASGTTPWVLALACDLPYLDGQVLRRWGDGLSDLPPAVVAYLPQRQGRWEPLCGFYRRSCREQLQRFMTSGGRSFQAWLNQQSVVAIATVDPQLLVNLNTPADLAALLQP